MSSKKKKILFGSLLIAVFAVFAMSPLVVNAGLFDSLFGDDTEEIVSFLQGHSDWLQYGSFLTIILHEIGWGFVSLFYILTSFLEGLVPQSLSLLGFLEDAGIDSIASAIINDLVVALMVLTLVFLGFKTIVAKEPPSFKSVGVNIFISAFLILGLPTLMNTMEDISVKFYDATQTGNNNGGVSSLAWGLVQDNTADLFYVADQGFDLIENGETNTVKNALTPDIFLSTNLTELVTPDVVDDLESPSNQVNSLKYTLSNDGQGNYTAIEVESGLLSWFSDSFESGYFRYPAKFFPMIIGLIALSVAYLFTLFVFITTIIEIGIKRVVALFVFATDLESGQRTKMVVRDIMNAFLLIAFNGLNLKFYTLFLSYLGTTDINIMLYIIAVVSATFVLIKGSNTIMRYFGVDVGVKDGFAQIAGAFAAAKALSSFGGKGKSQGKNPLNNNTKDKLNQNADEMAQSINDSNDVDSNKQRSLGNALKNSVNSAGRKAGYLSNRGLGGALEDAAKGTKEKMANGINQKGKSIADGVNNIKDGWKEGVNEGIATGEQNKEKWNQKEGQSPSVNGQETNASQFNDSSTGQQGIQQPNNLSDTGNKQENGSVGDMNTNKQSNEEILAKMKLDDNLPKNNDATGNLNMDTKLDGATDAEGNQLTMNGNNKGQSNEEILANMKLNDAMQPKNTDAEGNLNMRTQANKASMNNQETMQQNIASDMKANGHPLNQKGEVAADMKANSVPLNQKGEVTADIKVNSPENVIQKGLLETAATSEQQATQRVLQQVEQTSFANPESAKQSIIQAVQQDSFGSNDTKQKVIQEIERSSIATPEQVQQNVQQVLSSASLPQDTQSSVQRVIQDVQNSGSFAPDTAKSKVIQEVERASFGNETMKQNVIQEIQKAFSATPEQMEQNIKQTISAVKNDIPQSGSTESTSIVKEEKVTKSQGKTEGEPKYFGSLLGNDLEGDSFKPKKSSRFDKFYKK